MTIKITKDGIFINNIYNTGIPITEEYLNDLRVYINGDVLKALISEQKERIEKSINGEMSINKKPIGFLEK